MKLFICELYFLYISTVMTSRQRSEFLHVTLVMKAPAVVGTL